MKSVQATTAHAVETATDELGAAKKSTLLAVTGVLGSVVEGITATGVILGALRRLDRDDGLAWLGLSRRRSSLSTLAVFGFGAAAGATVALLFTPLTGDALRSMLFRRGYKQAESSPDAKNHEGAVPVAVKSTTDTAGHTRGAHEAEPENGASARA